MVFSAVSWYGMEMIDTHLLRDKDYLLAKRIQHLRVKRGMTQERLAEAAKVSAVFISMVETAKTRPSLKFLYKIAAVLDVKVADLFTF
jgi:transcriptional regulator with XRE-family HTH domain